MFRTIRSSSSFRRRRAVSRQLQQQQLGGGIICFAAALVVFLLLLLQSLCCCTTMVTSAFQFQPGHHHDLHHHQHHHHHHRSCCCCYRSSALLLPPSSSSSPLLVRRQVRRRIPLRREAGPLFADVSESTSTTEESTTQPKQPNTLTSDTSQSVVVSDKNVWEKMACAVFNVDIDNEPHRLKEYVQYITVLRVGIPSLAGAAFAKVVYPATAMIIARYVLRDDAGVFAVVASDASQYIQNVLTTSGLVFGLLVGQTYFFMEAIYLALFEEVTMAKSLLEQVALVSQGRDALYGRILNCMNRYVKEDLTNFNDIDPATMISARPVDDPLEDVLFLTSVGEPSIIYSTVRSLRQARAYRLGALQRKLPSIHMVLLWTLAGIVLFTFPLLGAGSQSIGGPAILVVQSWYLSFIVFGILLTLGVIYELQRPGELGSYNARTVLTIMVQGLEEELEQRIVNANDDNDSISFITDQFSPSEE